MTGSENRWKKRGAGVVNVSTPSALAQALLQNKSKRQSRVEKGHVTRNDSDPSSRYVAVHGGEEVNVKIGSLPSDLKVFR